MFGQQIVQGSFRGFSGLGDSSGASGQALRGSVVDVVLNVGQAWRVLSYTRTLTQALKDRLNNAGFQVQNIDDSNLALLTGGTIRIRVAILTDGYASAQDVASVVGGAASALGYNVTSSSGVLVSSGPNAGTGTGSSGQVYAPPATSNTPGSIGDTVSSFVDSLTKSPVTLAVIAGAVVILVIAAKK